MFLEGHQGQKRKKKADILTPDMEEDSKESWPNLEKHLHIYKKQTVNALSYKMHLQINMSNINIKSGKRIWTDISQMKKDKLLINIYKNT